MKKGGDMRAGSIFLLYVLAVLSLASCKASKNVEQQVDRDYSADFMRLSHEFDSIYAGFQVSQRQVTDKLSNLKVEHTTTYYTLPDSAGRQYPVYVSTTKADKDEKTSEKVYTDMIASIRRLEQRLDDLSEKVDAALKQEQKVAEVSWWDRHKGYVAGGAFCAVLVVIIAYIVYKSRKK